MVSDVLLESVLKGVVVSGCVQTDWHSSRYKVMAIEFPAELFKQWCNSSWLAENFIKLVTGGSQVMLGDFLVCNVGAVSSESAQMLSSVKMVCFSMSDKLQMMMSFSLMRKERGAFYQ